MSRLSKMALAIWVASAVVACKQESLSPLKSGSNAFSLKSAPSQSTVWQAIPDKTEVGFDIASNSAGVISGAFKAGVRGWVNLKGKQLKGEFAIDLETLVSVNSKGQGNPARDQNVIEAFFGSRPAKNSADAVDKQWDIVKPYLARGVKLAGLRLVEAKLDKSLAKQDGKAKGSAKAQLFLWDTLALDVQWPIEAERKGKTIEIRSLDDARIDLLQILGPKLRDAVFNTMLAAGCAHQAGIQDEVRLKIGKLVLEQK